MEAMTSQATDDRLGKTAYDAYCIQLGKMDEPWDGLSGTVQNAWIAAARVIDSEARNDVSYVR